MNQKKSRFDRDAEFESCKKLHHYTSLDTLKKILRSRSILLNRNDKLNDLVESERTNESDSQYFVTCFTHNYNESIPLWHMYAGKEKGVRISVQNGDIFANRYYFYMGESKYYFNYEVRGSELGKEVYNNVFHVANGVTQISNITKARMTYNDEHLLQSPTTIEDYGSMKMIATDIYDMAALKGTAWSFEEESRFFITMHNNINNIERVFVELSDKFFNGLEITINPFVSYSEYEHIVWELKTLFPVLNLSIKESSLTGTVK